jgi:glycosyltransferase involved in cell wall biosynthesis
MKAPLITIISPTVGRPLPILQRCIQSVTAQTSKAWQQWICSDGPIEPMVRDLVTAENAKMGEGKFLYSCTGERLGHYGAGVRAKLLGLVTTPFVCFVDDDSVIFPRYVEAALTALKLDQEAAFAVVSIIHHGPLPDRHGLPPKILNGRPIEIGNIDTLQVISRVAAMREVGWSLAGYTSDGESFRRLAAAFPCVFVEEVLAAHL